MEKLTFDDMIEISKNKKFDGRVDGQNVIDVFNQVVDIMRSTKWMSPQQRKREAKRVLSTFQVFLKVKGVKQKQKDEIRQLIHQLKRMKK